MRLWPRLCVVNVMAHADHGCLKVGDCVESLEIEGAEEL